VTIGRAVVSSTSTTTVSVGGRLGRSVIGGKPGPDVTATGGIGGGFVISCGGIGVTIGRTDVSSAPTITGSMGGELGRSVTGGKPGPDVTATGGMDGGFVRVCGGAGVTIGRAVVSSPPTITGSMGRVLGRSVTGGKPGPDVTATGGIGGGFVIVCGGAGVTNGGAVVSSTPTTTGAVGGELGLSVTGEPGSVVTATGGNPGGGG